MDTDDCCICLGAIKCKNSYTLDACKHKFHDSCINQWMMAKNTCPCCRKQTSDVDRYLLDRFLSINQKKVTEKVTRITC